MRAANILETIGHTPHIRINRLFGPAAQVWIKSERSNPGGSIKDRIGLAMVEAAERSGALKPGGVVFVQANIGSFEPVRSQTRKLVYWLNDVLSLKVGHPHPPRDRIAQSFRNAGAEILMIDYDDPLIDRVAARRR